MSYIMEEGHCILSQKEIFHSKKRSQKESCFIRFFKMIYIFAPIENLTDKLMSTKIESFDNILL